MSGRPCFPTQPVRGLTQVWPGRAAGREETPGRVLQLWLQCLLPRHQLGLSRLQLLGVLMLLGVELVVQLPSWQRRMERRRLL